MTAVGIIEQALLSGVMLSTDGKSIKLVADAKPSAELLESLSAAKLQIISELSRLQRQWLERVAHALHRPPDWLLTHGIIDTDDMCELWHTEPRYAVNLAKNSPRWHIANN